MDGPGLLSALVSSKFYIRERALLTLVSIPSRLNALGQCCTQSMDGWIDLLSFFFSKRRETFARKQQSKQVKEASCRKKRGATCLLVG